MATEIEKLEATIRTGALQFFEKLDALIAAERDRNELLKDEFEWQKERDAKAQIAFQKQKEETERMLLGLSGQHPPAGVSISESAPPRSPGDGPVRPPRHPRR